MSDYATKDDLRALGKDIDEKIDKAVVDLSNVIAGFAQQVDERFNKVEEKLDKLEASIDRLTNTVDGIMKRYDEMETENAARDPSLLDYSTGQEKLPKKLAYHSNHFKPQ